MRWTGGFQHLAAVLSLAGVILALTLVWLTESAFAWEFDNQAAAPMEFVENWDIECPPDSICQNVNAAMLGTFSQEDVDNGITFRLVDEDLLSDDLITTVTIAPQHFEYLDGVPGPGELQIIFTAHCCEDCHIDGAGARVWVIWWSSVTNITTSVRVNLPENAHGCSGEDCAELAIELEEGGTNYTGGDNEICCVAGTPGDGSTWGTIKQLYR
jgi:hypothetical protein